MANIKSWTRFTLAETRLTVRHRRPQEMRHCTHASGILWVVGSSVREEACTLS
jgi:hypothetical protein